MTWRPNGLAFSCRERAGSSLQNTNDLARSGRLHWCVRWPCAGAVRRISRSWLRLPVTGIFGKVVLLPDMTSTSFRSTPLPASRCCSCVVARNAARSASTSSCNRCGSTRLDHRCSMAAARFGWHCRCRLAYSPDNAFYRRSNARRMRRMGTTPDLALGFARSVFYSRLEGAPGHDPR